MTPDLQKLLRTNFEDFFVHTFAATHPGTNLNFSPCIEYTCDLYQTLKLGDRTVINQPARSLKTWSAKIFCAYYLGLHPAANIMKITNNQRLSEESVYDIRKIMRFDWYKQLFPATRLAKDRSSVSQIKTTRGGGVFAGSAESSLAGFGADLLLIDDINKIDDADRPDRLQATIRKFEGEIYSRLNNKKTGIVVNLQHRLCENDLSGHLIKKGYRHEAIPLVSPRKKTYRLSDGRVWHCQKGEITVPGYSQKEIDDAKQLAFPNFFWFCNQGLGRNSIEKVRSEDFRIKKTRMEDGPFIITIDAAQGEGSQNSFNVIQAWQRIPSGLHLYDQFRQQCGFTEFQTAAKNMIHKLGPSAVLIEAAANGAALYSIFIRRFQNFNVIAVWPRQTKLERLARHIPKIHNGFVSLQDNRRWIAEYLIEADNFPNGTTDQVDGTTMALDYEDQHKHWPTHNVRDQTPALVVGRPILGPPSIQGAVMLRARSIFKK